MRDVWPVHENKIPSGKLGHQSAFGEPVVTRTILLSLWLEMKTKKETRFHLLVTIELALSAVS